MLSTAYGLSANNTLLRFDTATPGTVQAAIAITGLAPGEFLQGIDFRPATNQLIALGVVNTAGPDTGRLYSLNAQTGVATPLAAGAAPFAADPADGAIAGFDFNPQSGGLRYVNDADQNRRLNATTGTQTGADTNLAYTGGDVNFGVNPAIAGVAYSLNFAGTPTTTLYGIDRSLNVLVRIGGLNGTPPPANSSPNQGELTTIGALGVTTTNAFVGFDTKVNFSDGTTTAFAVFTDNADGLTKLFRINLATGAATAVGAVGNGSIPLGGLALVPDSIVVVGADAGAGPHVKVFDGETNQLRFSFFAFDPSFKGGVRVATGDVNGDGSPDIIVGAGPGAGPHVKVFDGRSGAEVASVFAFDASFTGGVFVGGGDVVVDTKDDVLVGAGPGAFPHVKAFTVASPFNVVEVRSFFAFDASFRGGVTVAGGDINGDSRDDFIVGKGNDGGSHVRVFDGTTLAVLRSFLAFHAGFVGTTYVGAGDVNVDAQQDILAGGVGVFRAFNGPDNAPIATLSPYAGFGGGIHVAAGDLDGDGAADFLSGPGPAAQSQLRGLDGQVFSELESFLVFEPSFLSGIFVAAGR